MVLVGNFSLKHARFPCLALRLKVCVCCARDQRVRGLLSSRVKPVSFWFGYSLCTAVLPTSSSKLARSFLLAVEAPSLLDLA